MKILRYLLLAVLVIVISAGVLLAVTVNNWVNGPLPQHSGELRVEGLRDRVEIIRDAYGVPHIYASNLQDLLFAQGYTQAQDRWWQMEFARHTGHGRIMELTGYNRSLIGTDAFIRKVGWSAAAERDLAALPEEYQQYLQWFADGVNAYILPRGASQLAFEYNVLGLTGVNIPLKPWTPLDTLVWTKVMAWNLGSNYGYELYRSALYEALGEEMSEQYAADFLFERHTTIIQPEDLPPFGAPFAPPLDTAGIRGLPRSAADLTLDNGILMGRGSGIGSNNWVVGGSRTVTNMPLLANDPHLSIGMPSIWYQIGLHCQPVSAECPFNVRGFTFAPNPGVVIGHNGQIAWGVTNVGWDTQDLYLIKVNPDNPLQYEWNGEWRDMTTRREIIEFGDSNDSLELNVRITHLGPIINDFAVQDDGTLGGYEQERPMALRWTSEREIGTIFQALMLLNQAQNWDEFRVALSYWDAPSQNFVFADREGNIGYQTPGRMPVRAPGHTGLLPVDGSTDAFEWRGYVPYEFLPSVFNPERGYIATANQALVPFEYYASLAEGLADQFGADAHYVFSYDWASGYRGQRIVDLIEATPQHSVQTFRAIHGDNQFGIARDMAPFLQALDMGDAATNELRDWMLNWDYQMNADSGQAALFALVWRQVVQRTFNDQLALAEGEATGGTHEQAAIFNLLQAPENAWWDDITTDATETRDDILIAAFRAAAEEAPRLLGSNRQNWRWSTLHRAVFVSNPLGLSGIGLIENFVNSAPIGLAGGTEIVNAIDFRLADFSVRSSPSMRMIIDIGSPDNSLSIQTTGQSGHPASPHYTSMIDRWSRVEYNPMLFTREAVQAAAASTLILLPR
ncbi:MAG: penicillin acylase family protein [Anaerolinea sp.]